MAKHEDIIIASASSAKPWRKARTSARESFSALHKGLERIVDAYSKVLCHFDHRDWGSISEGHMRGRRLPDRKVTT